MRRFFTLRRIKALTIITGILASCNPDSTGNSKTTVSTGTAESFDSFNLRFHADSAFQLSRIAFPIEGVMQDGDTFYTWTPANWELHREPVKDKSAYTEYKHSVSRNDTQVIEKYWIDSSGFRIETRFARRNGKWFLVYYDDMEL
jgi:hypothetical protein